MSFVMTFMGLTVVVSSAVIRAFDGSHGPVGSAIPVILWISVGMYWLQALKKLGGDGARGVDALDLLARFAFAAGTSGLLL